MSLISLPTATIDDSDVAGALHRAVSIVNPVLDLLAGVDPLGLKKRTHTLGSSRAAGAKVLDAAAWVLNAVDVPGTDAWDDMDLDARINWWVRRVGAVDTILVATPGVFGVVADRLPVQDLLGSPTSRSCSARSRGSWASPIGASRCACWPRSCATATSATATLAVPRTTNPRRILPWTGLQRV
jgi:hypothetical protein